MSSDSVILPEHYKVLAAELKGLVSMIDEAFINRPVPQGTPWLDIESALLPLIRSTGESTSKLTKALNSLPGCMGNATGEPIADETIRAGVAVVKRQLSDLIFCLHRIWATPFPAEFTEAQPLGAAVAEDVLRKCRSIFLRIIQLAEMPPDKIERTEDNKVIISFTFGDEAMLRLTNWIQTKNKETAAKLNALRCKETFGQLEGLPANIVCGVIIMLTGGMFKCELLMFLGALLIIWVPLAGLYRIVRSLFNRVSSYIDSRRYQPCPGRRKYSRK